MRDPSLAVLGQKRLSCSARAASALLVVVVFAVGCAARNKIVLNDQELLGLAKAKLERLKTSSAAWRLFHGKQRQQAEDLLNQLLERFAESPLAAEAQLTLADLYFETGKLEEADAEYSTYLKFYPSSPGAQKALWRLLLTHYRRTLAIDRDQTHSHETLRLCRQYRKRYPFGDYAASARLIEQEMMERLAGHEFYVGRFYYRRRLYRAATLRLQGVIDNYPGTRGACNALFYLAKIDLKHERRDDALEKLETLLRTCRTCRYAKKAKRLVSRFGG